MMRKELFIDKKLNADFAGCVKYRKFNAGNIVINPGDAIGFIPIVASGALRIMLEDSKGAEYFLYHIYPGETCAVSLTCCMSKRVSEVKAVAEDETEIAFIPAEKSEEWMQFPEWKKFVSDTQALRFSELLETIGLIAFSKMDEQLWNYLIRKTQATGSRELLITHQEIANELNSPREVITRLLHKLQEQKKIRLSRNKIEVITLV